MLRTTLARESIGATIKNYPYIELDIVGAILRGYPFHLTVRNNLKSRITNNRLRIYYLTAIK